LRLKVFGKAGGHSMLDEKKKGLDERKAALQQMESKAADLNKKAQDTLVSEGDREAARTQLNTLLTEGRAKQQEIMEAEAKIRQDAQKQFQEMESEISEEIKNVSIKVIETKGLDLIFDKSFPPGRNKAILHTSDKVVDLTDEILATLNAGL
ncbi:MAG: OmpH family outer membrane protein, partial [Verrucomicrobiota bacterium]